MATPTATKSKDRILKKIIAILVQPAYAGAARESEKKNGAATIARTRKRVWVCAGVPSAGTGAADGDICLDTTNDDVYRYYDTDWDMLNVTT